MGRALPEPQSPYPSWARLLAALWEHGRAVISPEEWRAAVERATEQMTKSYEPRSESPKTRPSAFLSCQRQGFFLAQGEEPKPMPAGIGLTFAAGHFLHEVSYAFVRAALPRGFTVNTEAATRLPEWWPLDENAYRQEGTQDIVLAATGDVSPYLGPDVGADCLADFKSVTEFTWKKMKANAPEAQPDGFGYMAQLAVYGDGGDRYSENVLAAINRGQLMQPLVARTIDRRFLAAERDRLRRGFEIVAEGGDPGRDFHDRWGSAAAFYCGTGGRKGYCPFAEQCWAVEPGGSGDE